MKNLDFLRTAQVEAVKIETTRAVSRGTSLQKRPNEGAQLRLFKNGRIYPSEQFEADFHLFFSAPTQVLNESTGNVDLIKQGNGLDVFSSNNWTMVNLEETVLFCAVVPRHGNGKIDLFGSVNFEGGQPKRQNIDAGASTFAKQQLVTFVEEFYGVNWEEVGFVDLVVNTEFKMESPNGVYLFPKLVSRGEEKGKPTYVRRENVDVFPIVLAEVTQEEDTPEGNESVEDTTPTEETMEVPVAAEAAATENVENTIEDELLG